MALFTLGGGYGAVIENGRQEEYAESAQGKPHEGPQSKNTSAKNSIGSLADDRRA